MAPPDVANRAHVTSTRRAPGRSSRRLGAIHQHNPKQQLTKLAESSKTVRRVLVGKTYRQVFQEQQ
jgi:hypothetical protein